VGLEEELRVFEGEEDGVEDSEEGEEAEEKSYGFGEFEQHAPAPCVVYCFRGDFCQIEELWCDLGYSGAVHCAVHDEAVNSFGRNGDFYLAWKRTKMTADSSAPRAE